MLFLWDRRIQAGIQGAIGRPDQAGSGVPPNKGVVSNRIFFTGQPNSKQEIRVR